MSSFRVRKHTHMRSILLSTILASAGAASYLKPAPAFAQDRIVGGAPAAAGAFPFYAYVQIDRNGASVACGGSIISPTYILTAAHCFDDTPTNTGHVYLSLTSTSSAGQVRSVVAGRFVPYMPIRLLHSPRNLPQAIAFGDSDVTVHPLYKAGTPMYDLALVRLSVASKYPAIPIAGAGLLHGASAVVAGYGYTGVLSPTGTPMIGGFPASLQVANIPIVDPTLCSQLWGPLYNASQHTCAGSWIGDVDSCVGDSGGPMALLDPNGKAVALASVVSYGSGCAQYGTYGVYTRVVTFLGWIKSVVPNLPAYKQITAAIAPPAGDSVCTHAVMSLPTPTVVMDCGLNTIASIKLSSYTNQAYPCGAPGSGSATPTLAALKAGNRADCPVINTAACVGKQFCIVSVPPAKCTGSLAYVVSAACGTAKTTMVM